MRDHMGLLRHASFSDLKAMAVKLKQQDSQSSACDTFRSMH